MPLTTPTLARLLPWLLALGTALGCGGARTTDQGDFWQEAQPDPIAVFEPALPPPYMMRMTEETFEARIDDVQAFTRGPPEAAGADRTVVMTETQGQERRLHLRLARGVSVPLVRGEVVRVSIFSRLNETRDTERVLVIDARRPLGKGADFRPVLVVAFSDEALPAEALPRMLTGLQRTEKIAYRESVLTENECIRVTTHWMATQAADNRILAPGQKRKQLIAPGSRWKREEPGAGYDITLHDARRVTSEACPNLDHEFFAWTATWIEGVKEAKSSPAPTDPPATRPPTPATSPQDPPKSAAPTADPPEAATPAPSPHPR